MRKYREAAKYLEPVVNAMPDHHDLRYQFAKILDKACESERAEQEIQHLISTVGSNYNLQMDRAIFLFNAGRFEESRDILEKVRKELPPGDPLAEAADYNLHWHWLREGNFKEGMRAFYKRDSKDIPPHLSHLPRLNSHEELKGRRVLVANLGGGGGDEIINVRFAKYLKEKGAHVIWSSNLGLESLFARVEGVDEGISKDQIATVLCDGWISEGGLIPFLKLEREHVNATPYLSAKPELVEKWRVRLGDGRNLRVGLRWQGNMKNEPDILRSVPFQEMRRLFDIPNVDFFSLQLDKGASDIKVCDAIRSLASELTSYEETAAVIECLDVVVTSCTSIAHLAGALGKTTLLYTPLACFFIWAQPGDQSEWYQDVRLFRQSKRGQWSDTTAKIKEALGQLMLQKLSVNSSTQAREPVLPL
jgi:tetratricopeptide (TPR) repeat protein